MSGGKGLLAGCEALATGEVARLYDFEATAHLERYLSARGLDVDIDLRPVLEAVQHKVEAAYVTGSVCAGFANDASDIDLYVFVETPASQVPIPSYGTGFRVDLRHYNVTDIDFHGLDGAGPPPPFKAWRTTKRKQDLLGRVVTGVPLVAPSDGTWASRIPSAGVVQRLQLDWWSIEVVRRLAILGLTDDAEQPALARQRTIDVVLALGEVLACSIGELYFNVKWTGPKLERQGFVDARDDLLRSFAGEIPDELLREIRRAVEDSETLRSVTVGLHLPDDARVHDLGNEVLLEVGGRQGLLLTPEEHEAFDATPTFALSECVPGSIGREWQLLFRRQLAWLSAAKPEERSP